jgi:ApaG protein
VFFDLVLSAIDYYFRSYYFPTPSIYMVSKVTDGVKVTVLTEYQPDYSNPGQDHFVFTYKILIENHSEHTVKLLRRHWLIYDANGTVREVEGAGIVGLQPVLEPGDVHDYVSGCNLRTDMGKMAGTYLMERVLDGRQFRVVIPAFSLVAPYRLN